MRILTKIKLLILVTATLLVTGCATKPRALYNYGTYSDSYYAHKQNMTDESALKLQKSIEKAIENSSDSRSKRVAPGLYANLGYLYLKSGNSEQAIASFEKEKSIYPESTHFMDRMINKIKKAEGK